MTNRLIGYMTACRSFVSGRRDLLPVDEDQIWDVLSFAEHEIWSLFGVVIAMQNRTFGPYLGWSWPFSEHGHPM
jgi:hypothetical protein